MLTGSLSLMFVNIRQHPKDITLNGRSTQVLDPWKPTIAPWKNEARRGARTSDGTYTERWVKRLALKGPLTQYEYGTVTPWNVKAGEQPGIICAFHTGLIVIDVDDPEEYATTGIPFGREHAYVITGRGFHIYLDCRGCPLDLWPSQGPIPGGDIKSNGFVPAPGCYHFTGAQYVWTGNDLIGGLTCF